MVSTRDRLNAFLDLPEVVVANAQSGPLAGLSLGVKDIFDVAGHVTGCGNPDKAENGPIAKRTAPAVQALLDAGARFLGKTQTEELAFSMIGQNVHFPYPVNPRAPDRVTGGSSSGSAAAVAGGLADIATGSDTGGSIRAPASFCGLIGLRTTHGRISLEGTMPLAPSLDTFGWFARDIETYGKVGEVFFGEAGAAPQPPAGTFSPYRDGEKGEAPTPASPSPRSSRGEGKGEGQTSCRLISVPALDALVSGAAEADEYRRMTGLVSNVLGTPKPASFSPSIDDLYWCTLKLQTKEAWMAHGEWISARDRGLAPTIKERFAFGATVSLADALAEGARRKDFRAALRDLLGDDGFLVLPTVPGAAPKSASTPEQFQAFRERAVRLFCWSGLSGFPQITIPLGSVDGAPFGISLLGPPDSDRALIAMAGQILEAAKV